MDKRNLGVGCFVPNKRAERYIAQVLQSGRLSYGPFTQKFERSFAAAHDVRFGIMVNSGTSALRIAIACLKEAEGWSDGDEVLVPAVTFIATANTVISNGLVPVFVDVDPLTYNIDPKQVEKKITKKTRAMIPVHLMGQPADMLPLMKIARRHQLKIIEDSCETMFTKYRGKSVGSFGDISCFSTYVAHLIVTGVGGLALTNNVHYATILRSLANHGRDSIYLSIDDAKNKKGQAFKQVIARRFRFVRPGYSFRVTEFEGALGYAEMPMGPKIVQTRRKNASILSAKMRPFEHLIQLPWHPPHTEHAFMLFPIVVHKDAPFHKQQLIYHLESRGIETRDLMPLINQPHIQERFHIAEREYPVAQWVNENGFYIGCHQQMGEEELSYIVDTFSDFFSQRHASKKKK